MTEGIVTLTPREAQVLAGLNGGRSVREIGGILKLSDKTIYRALESARAKFGNVPMAQVLLAARDAGVLLASQTLTNSGVVALGVAELSRGGGP